MKRAILVVFIVLGMGFMGCGGDTAIVTSANMVSLIETGIDSTTVDTLSLGEMNNPNKVVVSPNNKKAYVCRVNYKESAGGDTETNIIYDVDLVNGTASPFAITENTENGVPVTRFIWDMELTRNGTRLIVGTSGGAKGRIEVYDTSDNTLLAFYHLPYKANFLKWEDRYGYDLTLHPTRDIVYAITQYGPKSSWPNARVRALSFESVESGAELTDLSTFNIAEPNLFFDKGDCRIKISPAGDLVIAVSSCIYPCKVEADGSLTRPYYVNGVNNDGKLIVTNPKGGKDQLIGKTDVLFTQNSQQIYVNWSGLKMGILNLVNGGSICLDKDKLLAANPDPFLFTWLEFVQKIVPNVLENILSDSFDWVADMLEKGMFGVAASTMVGNTIYMVIAPIVDTTFALEDGGIILVVFETTARGMQLYKGAKVLDFYPTAIAVNPGNDQLIVSQTIKDKDDLDNDNDTTEKLSRLMILDKHRLGWSWGKRRFANLDGQPLALGLATAIELP